MGIPADRAIKPAWIPTWLWAQTYDNNILGVTIRAPGVYPTPIYETVMALVGFAILWSARNHHFQAGGLFALCLLLAGVERLLIERTAPTLFFMYSASALPRRNWSSLSSS